ncbi:MAG: hypothetical protein JRI25_15595, partial [Deltaproteobacteria bacterium]|nr:hypothetical protein [Deltaproteobacteria bacterium]
MHTRWIFLACFWGASCLPLALHAAEPDVAQTPQAGSWDLERGESVEVEVGLRERWAVVDPEQVRVEDAAPGRLRVTALQQRGLAVVHVFGEEGTRTLVFHLEPASPADVPRRSRKAPEAASAGFQYQGEVSTAVGKHGATASTSHAFQLRRDRGDTHLDGSLTIAGATGVPYSVPHLRVGLRHQAVEFVAGDDIVVLGSGGGAFRIRGASARWWGTGDRYYVGGLVGLRRVGACCGLIERDSPVFGLVEAGLRPSARFRGEVHAGVVVDPSLDATLPLLRIASTYRGGDAQAAAEAFLIVRGGGFAGNGRFDLGEHVELSTRAGFVSRGSYVGRGYLRTQDTVHLMASPTWRVNERWSLWAMAMGTHVAEENRLATSLASNLGAQFRPGAHDAWYVAFGRSDGWDGPFADWTAGPARHHVTLSQTHSGALLRVNHVVIVRLDDDVGLTSIGATHNSNLSVEPGWTPGLRASVSHTPPSDLKQLQLTGYAARHWGTSYLRADLGGSSSFGGDAEPAFALFTNAHGSTALASGHTAQLGVGTLTRVGDSTAWRLFARYTFTGGSRKGGGGLGWGTVRGVVYDDLDANGVHDAGEPGLPGVLVQLDGRTPVVTRPDGRYRFGWVRAGEHRVQIERGHRRSMDGTARELVVTGFGTATANFAVTSTGAVSVRLYVDRDDDGRFSAGDPVLRAQDVSLRSVSGVSIASTPSSQPYARFPRVEPGTYDVVVDPRGLPLGHALHPEAEGPRVEVAAGEVTALDVEIDLI